MWLTFQYCTCRGHRRNCQNINRSVRHHAIYHDQIDTLRTQQGYRGPSIGLISEDCSPLTSFLPRIGPGWMRARHMIGFMVASEVLPIQTPYLLHSGGFTIMRLTSNGPTVSHHSLSLSLSTRCILLGGFSTSWDVSAAVPDASRETGHRRSAWSFHPDSARFIICSSLASAPLPVCRVHDSSLGRAYLAWLDDSSHPRPYRRAISCHLRHLYGSYTRSVVRISVYLLCV